MDLSRGIYKIWDSHQGGVLNPIIIFLDTTLRLSVLNEVKFCQSEGKCEENENEEIFNLTIYDARIL